MPAIALRYDLRSAPFAETKHPELYRTCLEQVAWCEENGVGDIVVLSEHHGLEDGFMSSPLTVAAAIAGKTSRLPISIAAALVPLHDPVRLAEQIATVDLLSGGRVSVVAGIGYAEHEFEMAGVDRRTRGQLIEESIEVMRKAWTGEPFEWRGRTIQVTPRPVSQPHPPLFYGGGSEAAARRAARLRMAFLPSIGDPRLKEVYDEECARVGHQGFCVLPGGPGFVLVAEDPDAAWAAIEQYAWYDATTYAGMQNRGSRSEVTSRATSPAELRAEGIYRVVTPDECLALAAEIGDTGTLVLHPLMGGMPASLGWRSLELFRDEVLPKLRPA